ncbi:hypothetical protein P3S68_018771 [Capsicum galapagoense]
MLRRKPSKIEVKIEDKEELEEARKHAALIAAAAATSSSSSPSTGASATTGATSLLQHFDRSTAVDPFTKNARIGLN